MGFVKVQQGNKQVYSEGFRGSCAEGREKGVSGERGRDFKK